MHCSFGTVSLCIALDLCQDGTNSDSWRRKRIFKFVKLIRSIIFKNKGGVNHWDLFGCKKYFWLYVYALCRYKDMKKNG